jgi:hypothetical protein
VARERTATCADVWDQTANRASRFRRREGIRRSCG